MTTFDALHDMGDPVGAARHVRDSLADDGTWMIVEPAAGDRVEDNLNPVGRAYYGFSTLLCTPASLSQDVGLALGTQAGPARIRDVVDRGGLHPVPHRGARRRSTSCSRSASDRDAVPRGTGRRDAVSRRRRRTRDRPGRPGGAPDRDRGRPSRRRRARLVGLRRRRRPTVLLMPTWSIMRLAVLEGAGALPGPALPGGHLRRPGQRPLRTGRPARRRTPTSEYAADTVAVLDATGTDRAVLVGLSCGATWAVHVAAEHPDRVLGSVRHRRRRAASRSPSPSATQYAWDERDRDAATGWAKYNKHYWLEGGYEDFLAVLLRRRCSPSRTRPSRSRTAVGWGARDRRPQVLVDTTAGRLGCDGAVCTRVEPLCAPVRCPVLGAPRHRRPGRAASRSASGWPS